MCIRDRLTYGTLEATLATPPDEIARALYDFIRRDENLRTTITSIGLPILTPGGDRCV